MHSTGEHVLSYLNILWKSTVMKKAQSYKKNQQDTVSFLGAIFPELYVLGNKEQ